ncbi:MAG: ABC transporter ATP-binding protein, partial [Chloroflexi bacterium]
GLGLENRLDAKVALLSGGQRQALTLLMATMTQPLLLLLDEHTAALDPGTAQKILELTRTLVAQQQLTTLMITHNMQQALTTGDRTLMMDGGQIVLDLSARERASMSVQDLVDQFTQVRHAELADDELLLA